MNPATTDPHFSRPFYLRLLLARPRLIGSVVLGAGTAYWLPLDLTQHAVTRAIVGWNVGALAYLLMALKMMFWSSHERMRVRALRHDEGNTVVLVLVVLAALMCLGAIVMELGVVKDLRGELRYTHMVLAGLTIATCWAFTQVMFALHYAHDYYARVIRGAQGGLAFPGGEAPDYGDFLYFACVIGTSAQTADVSFNCRQMRRTGLVHCVLAFCFNTTLLALTINIASGLL